MASAFKLLFSGVIGASLLAACSTPGPTGNSRSAATPAATVAPAPTADQAAVDAEIYTANCAICHRETGKGGKLILDGKHLDPDDLTAEKIKKMSDDKLIGYVTNGVVDEGMPAFKDKLSTEQIKQVIAHVRRLQSNQELPAADHR